MPPAESQTRLNDLVDVIRSLKDVLELLRRRLPAGWTFFPPSKEDDGLRLSHSTFDEVSFQSCWNRTLVLKSLFKDVDKIEDPLRFSVREISSRRCSDASVRGNASDSIGINPFDDKDAIVIVEREWSVKELLENVDPADSTAQEWDLILNVDSIIVQPSSTSSALSSVSSLSSGLSKLNDRQCGTTDKTIDRTVTPIAPEVGVTTTAATATTVASAKTMPISSDISDTLSKRLKLKVEGHPIGRKFSSCFKCKVCGEMFFFEDAFVQIGNHEKLLAHCHQKHKHGRKPLKRGIFRCKSCDKTFTFEYLLKRHEAKKHDANNYQPTKTDKGEFVCKICGKVLSQLRHLERHVHLVHDSLPHDRPFVCEVCGKAFKTKFNLSKHHKTHQERPYKCGQCGAAFCARCELNYHEIIHTGEKPFLCQQCGKGFNTKTYLHQHQVKVCKVKKKSTSGKNHSVALPLIKLAQSDADTSSALSAPAESEDLVNADAAVAAARLPNASTDPVAQHSLTLLQPSVNLSVLNSKDHHPPSTNINHAPVLQHIDPSQQLQQQLQQQHNQLMQASQQSVAVRSFWHEVQSTEGDSHVFPPPLHQQSLPPSLGSITAAALSANLSSLQTSAQPIVNGGDLTAIHVLHDSGNGLQPILYPNAGSSSGNPLRLPFSTSIQGSEQLEHQETNSFKCFE